MRMIYFSSKLPLHHIPIILLNHTIKTKSQLRNTIFLMFIINYWVLPIKMSNLHKTYFPTATLCFPPIIIFTQPYVMIKLGYTFQGHTYFQALGRQAFKINLGVNLWLILNFWVPYELVFIQLIAKLPLLASN